MGFVFPRLTFADDIHNLSLLVPSLTRLGIFIGFEATLAYYASRSGLSSCVLHAWIYVLYTCVIQGELGGSQDPEKKRYDGTLLLETPRNWLPCSSLFAPSSNPSLLFYFSRVMVVFFSLRFSPFYHSSFFFGLVHLFQFTQDYMEQGVAYFAHITPDITMRIEFHNRARTFEGQCIKIALQRGARFIISLVHVCSQTYSSKIVFGHSLNVCK